MTSTAESRMAALIKMLQQAPGLVGQLSSQEGDIVREALAGLDVHQLAQHFGIPETAVWEILGNAARAASGQAVQQVETGGLGSDTDPGISGGYGETGFGSLGNEPPFPVPEEPSLGEDAEDDARP